MKLTYPPPPPEFVARLQAAYRAIPLFDRLRFALAVGSPRIAELLRERDR